jgi:hypothetical protein
MAAPRLSVPLRPRAPNLGLTELHARIARRVLRQGLLRHRRAHSPRRESNPMILPQLGYSPEPCLRPPTTTPSSENTIPYGRVLTTKSPPGSFEWPGVFHFGGMLAHAKASAFPSHEPPRHAGAITNEIGEIIGVEATHGGATKRVRATRGRHLRDRRLRAWRRRALSFLRGPDLRQRQRSHERRRLHRDRVRASAPASATSRAASITRSPSWRPPRRPRRSRDAPTPTSFCRTGDSMNHRQQVRPPRGDEKAMYHERAQSHFEWSVNEYPNLVRNHDLRSARRRRADVLAVARRRPSTGPSPRPS